MHKETWAFNNQMHNSQSLTREFPELAIIERWKNASRVYTPDSHPKGNYFNTRIISLQFSHGLRFLNNFFKKHRWVIYSKGCLEGILLSKNLRSREFARIWESDWMISMGDRLPRKCGHWSKEKNMLCTLQKGSCINIRWLIHLRE